MDTQKQKRSAFSGKIGFVLSAAGASVGLGNIWRFPYLAAKYGGGIFLLVYIVLAVTFGYTMIVAETALGRMTHKSPVGAFGAFGKKGGLRFGGWINAVIPILIVPYYSVIGGWVIAHDLLPTLVLTNRFKGSGVHAYLSLMDLAIKHPRMFTTVLNLSTSLDRRDFVGDFGLP